MDNSKQGWWSRNMQKRDESFDTTRAMKMISLGLFAVYAIFFAAIMLIDGIRYAIGYNVNFTNSIKVIAYAGGVVVGSILLPMIDYRLHRGNGYGKKKQPPQIGNLGIPLPGQDLDEDSSL